MILRLTRRAQWRSSRARAVAAALFSASLASVVLGALLGAQHRAAGERDVASFAARLEAGAPEKNAFYLTAYEDVIVARGASADAVLAAGDLAALPDAAILRLSDPPTTIPSLAERSPSALLLGSLDFAWVLALLLPLGAIALAYDSVSRDRERGTLAMLLGPARSSGPLLFARTLAVAEVLLVGAFPGLLASFFVDVSAAVVIVAYTFLIAAIVVAISARAERSAVALATALGAWLTFGVAVPLSASAVVRASYPEPDPRARLAGEKGADAVFTRATEGIVATEVGRDPEMDPEQAEDGEFSQLRYDFLLMRERLRRKRGARYESDRVQTQRAETIELAAWLSPTSLVAGVLADVSGTRPLERRAFEKDASAYRGDVERFVRDDILARRSVLEDPERFPRLDRVPAKRRVTAWIAAALFLAGGIGAWFEATRRLNQGGFAPTKEDA